MTFYYVYVLQNINNHQDFYIGYTANLKQRLIDHNAGKTTATQGSNMANSILRSLYQ